MCGWIRAVQAESIPAGRAGSSPASITPSIHPAQLGCGLIHLPGTDHNPRFAVTLWIPGSWWTFPPASPSLALPLSALPGWLPSPAS